MKEKWILVTGGTSGTGLECVQQLVKRNHQVILTGRNLDKIEKIKQEINVDNLHTCQMDVTNHDQIQACREFILEITNGYGLDILINNAGYPQTGFLLDLPLDLIKNQYETNVYGMLDVTQSLFSLLQKNRGGIVNIGSVQGRLYVPFYSIYSSTKHAVKAISHLMRVEFKRLGVKVTLIEPGTVKTNFEKTGLGTLSSLDTENSLYADIYTNYQDNNYRPLKSMPGITAEKVAKKIASLINKKRWKASYPISIYGRIYLFTQKITPHWVGEWVTRRIFSL